jgi:hypothetical protein
MKPYQGFPLSGVSSSTLYRLPSPCSLPRRSDDFKLQIPHHHLKPQITTTSPTDFRLVDPQYLLGDQPPLLLFAFPPFPAPALTGGADRARTDDPLLAKQVLSQLSYSPPSELWIVDYQLPDPSTSQSTIRNLKPPTLVGLGRVELPTSRLSGVRSNHLSYRPPTTGARRQPLPASVPSIPCQASTLPLIPDP